MAQNYLGDEASLADLESRITSPDREEYVSYKNLRVEAAFIGRLFIIYRPQGLTSDNRHKAPEILTQVKVRGFSADDKRGCEIELEDMCTGQVMTVGHIPKRLFSYSVFVASPPYQRIRWDGRPHQGTVKRSLAFGILIKQRTRSDFFSMGATMMETPSNFRALYPNVDLHLLFA